MAKYQLFDDLDTDSYEKLKESIREKGVLVPIETDEFGEVLDGHHRLKICKELGIKEWPILIRKGLTESEKKNHARVLNLARRHLTKDQRKKVWADMRKDGMTLEAIAEADGTVSRNTVRNALDDVKIDNVPATITDTKGRKQPTKKKPRKPKTVYLSSEKVKKAQKLPEEQQQAFFSGITTSTRKPSPIKEVFPEECLINPEYRIGDFREVFSDIPESSVDMILTDPPYGDKSIDLYRDLGIFAHRVLKPGASLLTYCGQATLREVLNCLNESLRYWWTLSLEHTGASQQLPGKWVQVSWKPIVWFVKEYRIGKRYVVDRLRGDEPDKERLEWAQGISEVRHLIEQLTDKENLILDPFAGTGRWGDLAGQMGRRWIGADLESGGGLNT